MLKIFDVSNSSSRPNARGLGGPVENDIVRYLKKYANKFNCEFTTSECEADVIFTNDVFPKEYTQPKVKRMDGIYSRADLINRNEMLNISAKQSDCVIFISEFSKNSLEVLYSEVKLKKSTIILNAVDDSEFFNLNLKKDDKISLISTANNWSRPEKRGELILELANKYKNIKFNLIGSLNCNVPNNINLLGYINNYQQMNYELNNANGFIYLGFNDPAPKTVCQALNCQLPMLLTNSGGNVELAGEFGCYVNESNINPIFHHTVPNLNIDSIYDVFDLFILKLEKEENKVKKFNPKENFLTLLESYFRVFKQFK
jgi:hypothetical protein